MYGTLILWVFFCLMYETGFTLDIQKLEGGKGKITLPPLGLPLTEDVQYR